MKLILIRAITLYIGVTGTAYYVSTPGDQVLVAVISGLCLGLFVTTLGLSHEI